MPAPTRQSHSWSFVVNTSIIAVVSNTKYLGDSSRDDWVSSGTPVWYDQGLMLTVQQDTVGTLVSSSVYVWYGKITTRLKTSAGAGVVTSFILYADSKDEIDIEFVGSELDSSQTSYYSRSRAGQSMLERRLMNAAHNQCRRQHANYERFIQHSGKPQSLRHYHVVY